MISSQNLKQIVAANPALDSIAKGFAINPSSATAKLLVEQVLEVSKNLNGESKALFRAARMLFATKNYLLYRAMLYELEAKKHDYAQNNYFAAREYIQAAQKEANLNVKVGCFHNAFYCALKAKMPLYAIKVAKELSNRQITQGMAKLYFEAGKIAENCGDVSLAEDFYLMAIGGDYEAVKLAEAAAARLAQKYSGEPYDSRFANRQQD